jgi:1-acyl-sn-glycerol-3-phosphate acyltransferase
MKRTVLATIRTMIAVPTFFVFTLLASGYVLIVVAFRPHSPHVDTVIQLWSRLFLSVAPITWTVEGRDRIDPNEQYIFVSNHLSNFDIPLLFRAIPNRIRYMAKAELFKIPLLSQAMSRVGIIKIDRGAGRTAHAGINRGVEAARDLGYSLIVFPEAARARDGQFHGFKKGAFRIAITNELPVVPVTVYGTWEVWRPGAWVFYPGRARVVIHDPIPVAGLTVADIETLRQQTRDIVETSFNELRSLAVNEADAAE